MHLVSNNFFDNEYKINCYFEQYGTEGPPIILLHGWGANGELFRSIAQCISKDFLVYVVDFPGFGRSDIPPEGWSVSDYKEWLVRYLQYLHLDKVGIIAHSFGGRVSIKLAAENPSLLRMLILVDSAGIRPRNTLRSVLIRSFFKSFRKLSQLPFVGSLFKSLYSNFYRRYASPDYQSSIGVMRQTFLKVVNEDLRDFLPRIQSPTLLVWGENDDDTPVSDARVMEKLIPDAGLVVLKGAGHYSFLNNPAEFCIIANNFLTTMKK